MKPAFKALLLLLGMLLPASQAHASKEPWEEYEKVVKSALEISSHGPDLFGDDISLQNGALSFRVKDVSIPGSNALPVAITRTFATKTVSGLSRGGPGPQNNVRDAPMGDWDIDLPNISAVFPLSTGWVNVQPAIPHRRCSVDNPGQASARTIGISGTYFAGDEIWQGTRINLPGKGSRAMLVRDAASQQPASGGAYWTTSDRTSVTCLPSILNGAGEGFLATDANGNRYRFDWHAAFSEQSLAKRKVAASGYHFLERKRYALYATRVEDRFGNWVHYSYSNGPDAPVKLDRIESSDGRIITLSYANGHVSNVSANGRSWTYDYSTAGSLASVVLPDNSSWALDLGAFQSLMIRYYQGVPGEPWRSCTNPGDIVPQSYVGTVRHPSGAIGAFTVEPTRFVKNGIDYATNCAIGNPNDPNDDEAFYPMAWDSYSVVSKRISGPGVQDAIWNYAYFEGNSTQVQGPGEYSRYTFGNTFRQDEGMLLKAEHGASPSQLLEIQESGFQLQQSGAAYPNPIGRSGHPKAGDFGEEYVRPQTQMVTTHEGVTYRSAVSQCGSTLCFDTFARPTSETKSSSLGYTKTDTTEYHDDLTAWVLGQVKRTTTNGIETARTSFDARSLPWQQYAFGKLQQTLTYLPDGTVATVADGRGLTTSLNNWKRGIPQSIQYADGTSQSAVVNDNGWITSVTDQNGFTSQYDYDAMGRMKALFHPTGDSTAWNPVSIQFNQILHADRGLPAGHWRQDRFEGNRHTHTYFDALWRPVMTLDYDVASAGHNVQTQTITRYDTQGRVAFKSYPARHVGDVNASLPGTRTQYDALDRVTRVEQDSEQGPLVTTTEYLHGNSIRTTNPRGHATTSHYVAYDQPAYDLLAWSAQPEGRTIEIHRDVFGKPLWMRQRAADNSAAVIRHFVYDTHQQLCKSIEPETGATVMDYDAGGNLAWTASGLSLPSTTDCNFNEAWNSGRRTDRGYDNRNRLSSLALADGRGNQQWQYTADGLPAQITTWNDPGNGAPVINAYTYNKRRLLTGESVTQPGWYTWSLGYGYDANGQLASQVYPDGFTVNYSPNALGQPTEVRDASGKAYASNVSYYPNGGMSGFTYGNGVVHGMQQNLRQLPMRSTDNGVMNYSFAYDQNANPIHIADDLQGAHYSRWMTYDGLDRLTDAGSGSFGGDHWHRFTYNALDNLTSWKLAGVKDYASYGYDASNRLTNIRNSAGATVVGLAYDLQGNLQNKNGQAYSFDMGNRLREVAGKETYRYDGHGRRVQSTAAGTGHVLSLYSSTGTLMRQESDRSGRKENMIHLNGSLIAKHVQTTPPLPPASAPVLTAPTQANSGDFNLNWSSVERATRYLLEENPNNTGWTTLQDGSTLNRAVTGKPPGSYAYRVKACNASGCSVESAVKTVTVPNAPANAPNLTTPASSTTGNYVVSWTGPATASRHVLEENASGAGWVGIHDGTGFSKSISGKASGNYAYRVKGCNAGGCGPYSAQKTVTVSISTQAPAQPPTIIQSVSMHRGILPEVRCGVQWTAVANAAHYELKASTGAVQYQGPNTYAMRKDTSYCAPSHVVRACNSIGCSAWSAPPFNQVEIPWTDTVPGVP